MTLVIGIRCADGVVMGADSAATFGGIPPTITQPIRKLDVVDGKVIVGMSGHKGIHQLHIDSISRLWEKKKPGKNAKQTVADVQRMFMNALSPDVQKVAKMAQGLIGVPQELAQYLTQNSVLVALPNTREARAHRVRMEWSDRV